MKKLYLLCCLSLAFLYLPAQNLTLDSSLAAAQINRATGVIRDVQKLNISSFGRSIGGPAGPGWAKGKALEAPIKFINTVNAKTISINAQLVRESNKYVTKITSQEQKLQSLISRVDSPEAVLLFPAGAIRRYAGLLQKLQGCTGIGLTRLSGTYLQYLDSIGVSLQFLNKNPGLISVTKVSATEIHNSLNRFRQLESRLQVTGQIQQLMMEKRAQLQHYLARFTRVPSNISRAFSKYDQELYYYKQQITQYKETLNDPNKMLSTSLAILNRLPAFRRFISKNSRLAGLINLSGSYGPADTSLKAPIGLQSRSQLFSQVQARLGTSQTNTAMMVQASLQSGMGHLSQVIGGTGAGVPGGMETAGSDFRPNIQKTKSFFNRIELGMNLQTTPAAHYFPATTDVGLSAAYKINNANEAGIGASYDIGWGSGIKHIRFALQGLGLRTFIDLQIKKSFFITGGMEFDYLQPIASFHQVYHLNTWQPAGLIGITKKIALKSQFFKVTEIQVLWNFLSSWQRGLRQPIIFRMGYDF